MSKLQDVENAVVSGKSKLVAGLVQEALDEGCSAPDIFKWNDYCNGYRR